MRPPRVVTTDVVVASRGGRVLMRGYSVGATARLRR
jgi:hypothetical protein